MAANRGKSAGEKKSRSKVGGGGGGGFRESKKKLEHFRGRFIWPAGTIKLFSQVHVKNSSAESVLLEQRDHVRRPVGAMRRVERQL